MFFKMEYAKHVPVNKKIRNAEFFSGVVTESGGFFLFFKESVLWYWVKELIWENFEKNIVRTYQENYRKMECKIDAILY
jgi:predicted chitinase